MKIGFLITVRLKSTRLKRKVLKDLNGYLVIERVIQRAKKINNINDIILCTSYLIKDLPLIEIAKKNKIKYFRGDPKDVLQRLLEAAELNKVDYFLGITADNPLFSIHHANVICNKFRSDKSIDYIYTSGLPIGLNIYGIKTKALKVVCAMKQEIDTEIWGDLINQPKIFNVEQIKVEKKYQNNTYRMTLDEILDYKFLKKIYQNFPKNSVINILDVYKYLSKNPKISSLNQTVKQKELAKNTKIRIANFYKKNEKKILKFKKKIFQQ